MAYYLVTARPRPDRLDELERRLRERAFVSLRPFGQALTRGLENARIRGDGRAAWEEEDYCTPPLQEERAAVLDGFFDDIRVTAVARGDGWERVAHLPRLFPDLAP